MSPRRPVHRSIRLSGITQSTVVHEPLPSARELFPYLRARMLPTRPIIGHRLETVHADGRSSGGTPIFGRPTFRNVIENGIWQ